MILIFFSGNPWKSTTSIGSVVCFFLSFFQIPSANPSIRRILTSCWVEHNMGPPSPWFLGFPSWLIHYDWGIYVILVGGDWNMAFMTFHILGVCHHPNWRTHSIIFQRGGEKPPTRIIGRNIWQYVCFDGLKQIQDIIVFEENINLSGFQFGIGCELPT